MIFANLKYVERYNFLEIDRLLLKVYNDSI